MRQPTPANGFLTPAAYVQSLPRRRHSEIAAAYLTWVLMLGVLIPLTFWLIPEMLELRREMQAERKAAADRQALEQSRVQGYENVQRRLVEREAELLKAQRDNLKIAVEMSHKLKGE